MVSTGGWWTSTHVLVLTNAVLAGVALLTIRSSNRVARSADEQAKATNDTVDTAVKQLRLDQEQLELDRRALEASIRPLIASAPRGQLATVDRAGTMFVPIRNVGPGVAIVHDSIATTRPASVTNVECGSRVIATSDGALIIVPAPTLSGLFQAKGTNDILTVGIQYSDVGDGQRTETVIHLRKNPANPGQYLEEGLEMYACDQNWRRAEHPFVTSGTGWAIRPPTG